MAEEMSKIEMIGFHKGAITTLANERRELLTMAGTVDKLIAAHIKALQEMGVKIVGDASKNENSAKTKALEDLLK